ncbi:hypothetical protein DPMN_029414 [Dreissena polymorpha]|uniref:Uncharacterized protein n=1 Tax=Dreissena polymorpha TaxID=45954 RepID=A0A9D4LZ62_DREPO|nr:hypothetical protein DPMN_029414 [Dreissena polymorpha]
MKCWQYYCFVILKTVLGSGITRDNFAQVKTDYVIRTGGALLQKRSVIECSKACLKGANDCGFNYVKHDRQCACVTSDDLQRMSMETKPGASVYIHGQCTQEFQVRR